LREWQVGTKLLFLINCDFLPPVCFFAGLDPKPGQDTRGKRMAKDKTKEKSAFSLIKKLGLIIIGLFYFT
jgi:hypothetical protein